MARFMPMMMHGGRWDDVDDDDDDDADDADNHYGDAVV